MQGRDKIKGDRGGRGLNEVQLKRQHGIRLPVKKTENGRQEWGGLRGRWRHGPERYGRCLTGTLPRYSGGAISPVAIGGAWAGARGKLRGAPASAELRT